MEFASIAQFKLRAGTPLQALKYARLLGEVAPWRAESYDWLSYVAKAAGHFEAAHEAKILGEKVFANEQELFRRLNGHFDG